MNKSVSLNGSRELRPRSKDRNPTCKLRGRKRGRKRVEFGCFGRFCVKKRQFGHVGTWVWSHVCGSLVSIFGSLVTLMCSAQTARGPQNPLRLTALSSLTPSESPVRSTTTETPEPAAKTMSAHAIQPPPPRPNPPRRHADRVVLFAAADPVRTASVSDRRYRSTR